MHKKESEYLNGLNKAIRYCSYRERCEAEVSQKLKEWDLDQSVGSRILEELKREKYIDDRRYANTYAGSKFRVNGWGKIKIRAHLALKHISKSIVNEAIDSLHYGQYLDKLEQLLRKKRSEVKGPDDYKKRIKVMNFGRSKGYEYDIIMDTMDRIFKD